MKDKTRTEAIDELVKHDHSFLRPEYAEAIAKVFGLKNPPVGEYKDTRTQHKGLTLKGLKEGDTAQGIDADTLACWVANKIGAKYTSMFGRGSALRECCRAVKEKIEKTA